MRFTFHPYKISLFSLVHFKNRLRIIEENLYSGLIINDFPIPLREEAFEVDNYNLCYNIDSNVILLSLSNHILIYSIDKKSLLSITEMHSKSTPYYITKIVSEGKFIYFSATDQKCLFSVSLDNCIKNQPNYTKFKISA